VNASIQPWLPKVNRVERVQRTRKFPQPRGKNAGKIRKYELLYRPFDLRFRGRINAWLVRLIKSEMVFGEMLTRRQQRIIKLYFFPQEGRWLNQKEVVENVKGIKLRKLRRELVETLILIWKGIRNES